VVSTRPSRPSGSTAGVGHILEINKMNIDQQLQILENTYILGLSALALFSSEKILPILEESHVKFGKYTIPFDQVATLLRDVDKRNAAEKEYILLLLRALIKETYEIIKARCNVTGKVKEFKSQKWYHFSRLIRNCISHNYLFDFKKEDLALLPVKWSHCTIDCSMNGKPISLKFFGYVEVIYWNLILLGRPGS
jgi:hypothetical protein